MATVIYSYPIAVVRVVGLPGPPARTALGYFSGCPSPQLPVCRVPMPVLRAVAARCCVTPPFLPMPPWFVIPPLRYTVPPVLVWR